MLKFVLAGIFLLASLAAYAQKAPPYRLKRDVPKPAIPIPPGFDLPMFANALPAGKGDAVAGHKIFAAKCSGCHRPAGREQTASGRIGGAMLGCWRYPRPMFHFVKRMMPTSAPNSLKDAEVYAVLAYILWDAGVIGPKDAMDARTLVRVTMPNRDGLVPIRCAETSLYR